MILVLLLIITLVGGSAAWAVSRWSKNACRWLSLITLFADLAVLVILSGDCCNVGERWFVFIEMVWILIGVNFELGGWAVALCG
jgi:NADH:ubiquinone oxidoreductase subunit 4 (subunit M)